MRYIIISQNQIKEDKSILVPNFPNPEGAKVALSVKLTQHSEKKDISDLFCIEHDKNS